MLKNPKLTPYVCKRYLIPKETITLKKGKKYLIIVDINNPPEILKTTVITNYILK